MLSTHLARHLVLAGTCLAFAGCTSDSPVSSEAPASQASAAAPAAELDAHGGAAGSEYRQGIEALRTLTARWHDRKQAEAAGYTVDVGCSDERTEGLSVADARGMGYHTLNPALLDDRTALLEPELLVYASDNATGQLRLAAFDYFIPGSLYPAPDQPGYPGQPPILEGTDLPLTWNDAHGGWIIHSWPWMRNPDGMFQNFNPRVPLCDCEISPTVNLCTP